MWRWIPTPESIWSRSSRSTLMPWKFISVLRTSTDSQIETKQYISLTKKIQSGKLIPLSINDNSSWFMSLFAFWVFWLLFLTTYYRKAFEKITRTCVLFFSHFASCSNPNFQPAFAGGERHGKVPMVTFQKLTCNNDTPQAPTDIVLEG